jgi:hypothetical protein
MAEIESGKLTKKEKKMAGNGGDSFQMSTVAATLAIF